LPNRKGEEKAHKKGPYISVRTRDSLYASKKGNLLNGKSLGAPSHGLRKSGVKVRQGLRSKKRSSNEKSITQFPKWEPITRENGSSQGKTSEIKRKRPHTRSFKTIKKADARARRKVTIEIQASLLVRKVKVTSMRTDTPAVTALERAAQT